MDTPASSTPNKSPKQQRLPPRRGQIKIRILKAVLQFTKALNPTAGGRREGGGGGGGFVSSNSATPKGTPSGYNSDS
ncbi:hypothetical protein CDL15_Pgr017523 [Punica granatum]|uniref:Uncharacterized protein n=1 Tax=Punica granatum TaxID=22663 RepID=A0A218W5B4_PUNGR|nr:hypothetical protein CDL15_Pgr017523 [Punica granatum]